MPQVGINSVLYQKNLQDRANCFPEKEILNIIVLFRAKSEGFLRFILHFSNTSIYFSVSTNIEIPKANGTISVKTVFHSLKYKKYSYSGIFCRNSKQRKYSLKNLLFCGCNFHGSKISQTHTPSILKEISSYIQIKDSHKEQNY